MADLSVTYTLVNGQTSDATLWNTNYSDIVKYINNSNDPSTAWDGFLLNTTGNISVATAGTAARLNITQSDNTDTNSISLLTMSTGGGSAGDPFINFSITGTQNWLVGIDNSNSDIFVISASATPGSTDVIQILPAGRMDNVLGDIRATRSEVGGDVSMGTINTDNTDGASNAKLFINTGGSSSGDPYINFSITGVSNWSIGADNSDSDKLKIANTDGFASAIRGSFEAGAPYFHTGLDGDTTNISLRVNGPSTTAANTATLTNSPVAGNPSAWLQINANGTNVYIPVWS
jgi:hypothetical protein